MKKAPLRVLFLRYFYFLTVSGAFAAMRNSTKPITNSRAIMPTPVLMLPVIWLTTLTMVVPKFC